jgi:hypothetical protein
VDTTKETEYWSMQTLSGRTRLDLAIVRLDVGTFRDLLNIAHKLLNTVPVKDYHHSRKEHSRLNFERYY